MRTIALGILPLLLTSCVGATASAPRTIEVSMHWSRYSPAAIGVSAGTTVEFRVRNDDPITHEFVIGTPAEQLAHEKGPDHTHDGKPGQATIDPFETDVITFTFSEPGTFLFACHRPGHYAYGMVGAIRVT